MLKQIIYNKGLYLCGRLPDVLEYMKKLSLQYKTVKELIEEKSRLF